MALNPYFLNGTRLEQGLVQDLTNELIRMAGQDVIYLPRKIINEKNIIKEILVSKFDSGFSIEAYVLTYDGFSEQGDILTKFGVRTSDEITFVLSKERYEQLITPFIRNNTDIKLTTRPQEGDLIYLPIDNGLFEIKYVDVKKPFYQLNNLYSYVLKCELFEYEDEYIDTGINEVDQSAKNFGYIQTLRMVGEDALNAQLSIGLSTTSNTKSVQFIDIINGGYGYKGIPSVKITNPPNGGVTATAVATLKSIKNQTTIDKILIINPGYGYSTPPNIEIITNSGSGFIGTCVINSGVLGAVNIVNGGSDYSTTPAISISTSITGNNAVALAKLDAEGSVVQVYYENAGSGYSTSPNVTISPSVGVSSGTFTFNEIVTGQTTNTTAYVKEWDFNERILKVSIIDGNFSPGEIIEGENASYKLYSVDTYDVYNAFASNEEIKDEVLDIIDFSEINPFGNF